MSSEFGKKVVEIDKLNLDKECKYLASNYLAASDQAAEAKKDYAEADANLKVVEASVSMEIRSNPADFGLDKITESAVRDAVTRNADYRKALKAVQAAQYQQDLCTGLVWALDHKKRALTLLVDLQRMSYFATVKPRSDSEEPKRNRRLEVE